MLLMLAALSTAFILRPPAARRQQTVISGVSFFFVFALYYIFVLFDANCTGNEKCIASTFVYCWVALCATGYATETAVAPVCRLPPAACSCYYKQKRFSHCDDINTLAPRRGVSLAATYTNNSNNNKTPHRMHAQQHFTRIVIFSDLYFIVVSACLCACCC